MAKKQFKAESKRLLDMMIHSIYTHKEIFLRELISNASDAMDKLYFKSMQENLGLTRDNFEIFLAVDKEKRTLTVKDNGIGMDKEELENNLGVIAQSGSFKFKQENTDTDKDEVDVIGQFGVGFYSAFMVAKNVTVVTKKYGSEQAYRWESEGVDGYTITECEKDGYGTEITLQIKDNVNLSLSKVRSTMCNCGCLNIPDFQKNAKLTLVSSTSIVEGGSHDVILKESSRAGRVE